MGYKVKIEAFEGPFDLLVYLIESARMNIYDIQVSEITSQYLEYVENLEEADVTRASEFIVLAAELIQLKSKMLLPRITSQGEVVIEEDPRKDLVERLLEYKRFKAISQVLAQGEETGLLIYAKPQEDISQYLDQPDEYLSLDLGQFVSAFHAFLRKKTKEEDIKDRYERVKRQQVSAEEKMAFIAKLFQEDKNKQVDFNQLLQKQGDRYEVALTFSSILEMAKKKQVEAHQVALFGDITVKRGAEYDK